MHCTDVQQNIDDYLDGVLDREGMAQMDSHLTDCEGCRDELKQSRILLSQLKDLPVIAMRRGFSQQAFKRARLVHDVKAKHKHWFAAGFGGAIAAGLMLVMVMGPMRTMFMPLEEVGVISMSVQEERSLRVVFNAPEAMEDVELELVLTEGLELASRPGKRKLRWQTSLKAGKNRLTIPVRALKSGSELLLARLHKNGKEKEFRIQLDIRDNSVSVEATDRLWI